MEKEDEIIASSFDYEASNRRLALYSKIRSYLTIAAIFCAVTSLLIEYWGY